MECPSRFFRKIVGPALSEGLDIEFRCLHPLSDKDSLRPRQFWFESLKEIDQGWSEIEDLNARAYDIHYTVAGRKRVSQGKKEHPLPDRPFVSCFWADLDVGEGKPYETVDEALASVQALKPPPNIIIESGNGLHLYYLLKKPRYMSRERLESLLCSLAELLHGDMGAARATRLMRVPNTFNCKDVKHRKLAKITFFARENYRLRDLEAAWNGKESKGEHAEQEEQPRKRGSGKYFEFFAEHVSKLVLSGNSSEAKGRCPLHEGGSRSFSVNVETGLWKCHSERCKAKGNVVQFCKLMNLPIPEVAILRFPRLRKVPRDQEWAGEKIFQEVYDYITRQICFSHSWQPVFVTLWALGTYVYMQFSCYGHLWINSPTTHSGKTKLEDVMSTICYKATEPQLNPTAAVLFRFPSSIGGTLILDEIDRLSPDNQADVIAVLNSYKSTGGVLRNVPGKNKQYRMEEFKVYCPKIIAGINNLPEVLQDRSFKFLLHRKRNDQKVERFMPGAREEREPLRNQLEAWATREGLSILEAYQRRDQLGIPAEADDRLRDISEPLFAIAAVLPASVKDKLVEGTRKFARDRRGNEAESDPVVLGVQILNQHFPPDRDRWSLRSESAFELFEEIPGIDTVPKAQALLRRLGFRSQSARIGEDKVLHAYVISRRRLDRLLTIYGRQESVA